MIELLSEKRLRSYDYLRIQNEFRELWDRLFLNKDYIDSILFHKLGRFWVLGKPLSQSRLRNVWFFGRLLPKMGEGYLSSDVILAGCQLALGRMWEYPWAILNSDIAQDTKILDVGSGASLFPLYLAKRSNYVDSVDTNEYQMKVISPTLAETLKVKVNYYVDDAVKLSAKDNTYDYVFCLSVLEHLEQKMENGMLINEHLNKLDRLAIKEFLRVVKPGGRVILTLDYGNEALCKDWIQCFFEFDYVKEMIEEFSANLVKPLENFDEIKLTLEREREVIELWSEFHPYTPQEKPRFGTALGIMLTKH